MSLALPFIFTNGTTADATQVDANFAALVGAINSDTRTILAAPTTFYMSPTGSDTVTALNPAQPAATFNYIAGLLYKGYDTGGQVVTIQMANGTYNQNALLTGLLPGQTGQTQLILQGNTGTPSLVVLDGAAFASLTANFGAGIIIQGVHIQSSGSVGLLSSHGASILFQNCEFGSATTAHLLASRAGQIASIGAYTITGSANYHAFAQNDSQIYLEGLHSLVVPPTPGQPTITLTGTPAWGTAFIGITTGSLVTCFATFAGSATGLRASVVENGVLHSGGNPNILTTYLPGSSNPTTATGGQIT